LYHQLEVEVRTCFVVENDLAVWVHLARTSTSSRIRDRPEVDLLDVV